MEHKVQKALIWIRNFAYIANFIIWCIAYSYFSHEDLGEAAIIFWLSMIGIFIVYFILSKICHLALTVPKSKRFKDEKIYSQVLSEIESNDYRKGLLAKALSEAKGNEEKSRAIYIKLRYQSIKDEGK
jgi:biopolymer transport protein ExbB/TolQ